MKKLPFATLFLCGALFNSADAIDLTPHDVAADGPLAKFYFFQDEGKRVAFHIDSNMTVSGTSTSAAFGFNDTSTAGVKLAKSQMKPDLLFNEKNLESYRAAARAFLPPNAANILLDAEKPDAIRINRWTSHQFIFSYNLFGTPYRRSITFLNYSATEQLVLDVSGAVPEYDKTYLQGYRVLNSLSDLTTMSGSGPT